jgi:hypothetical protein
VGLVQLIRFLVVELTHSDSNPKFDIGVVFTANYSFSRRRRPRRQRCTLGDRLHKSKDQADSVFRGAYRGRMCVRVFIWVSAHTCMSICVCTVFLKKEPTMPSNIIQYYINYFL